MMQSPEVTHHNSMPEKKTVISLWQSVVYRYPCVYMLTIVKTFNEKNVLFLNIQMPISHDHLFHGQKKQ